MQLFYYLLNKNVHNCIMLVMLKTIFAVYLQTKTICKGRSSMLLRLMGNYSQMSLGKEARPSVLQGFPPNFSIFETHVHIVSKHSASLWRNLLYFPCILPLGFLPETNTEHPINRISVFQTGNMSRLWQMTTLGRSLSPCFPIAVPSPLSHHPSFTTSITPRSVCDCCSSVIGRTGGIHAGVSRILTGVTLCVIWRFGEKKTL